MLSAKVGMGVFFLLMILLVFLPLEFTPPAQLSHGQGHRVFVSSV